MSIPGHVYLKWQYQFEETFDVFHEILQRHCKLVILGTLDMPGYAHPNWYYQLVEKLVYLLAKNQLHHLSFSGDIVNTCKIIVLGTLGMPDYAHPKWQYQIVKNFDPCHK